MGNVIDLTVPKKKPAPRYYYFTVMMQVGNSEWAPFYAQLLDEQLYKYALIMHDRSVLADGSPAKPHYHVLLYVETARTVSAFLKHFKISQQWVFPIGKDAAEPESGMADGVGFAKYMLHNTYKAVMDGKEPYNIQDVEGTLFDFVVSAQDQGSLLTEDIAVLNMLNWIEDYDKPISYTMVTRIFTKNGWFPYYRRAMIHWREVIREHNDQIDRSGNKVVSAEARSERKARLHSKEYYESLDANIKKMNENLASVREEEAK